MLQSIKHCLPVAFIISYIHCLTSAVRSASNPMDKGAYSSINSEIQTWLPCTIISKDVCGGACSSMSSFCCDKAKLGNKFQWHDRGIVAQAIFLQSLIAQNYSA